MQKEEKKILNLAIPDTVYRSDMISKVYEFKDQYNTTKMINRLEWDLLVSAINHALIVSASMGEDKIDISDNTDLEYDKHIMIYYGDEDHANKICLFNTDSADNLLYYLLDKGYSVRQIDDQKFYVIFFNLTNVQAMRYYAESLHDYILGIGRTESIPENKPVKFKEILSKSKFRNKKVEEFSMSTVEYIRSYMVYLFHEDGYELKFTTSSCSNSELVEWIEYERREDKYVSMVDKE